MKVLSSKCTQAFQTEESRIFNHPSRVSDLYHPFVESIVEVSQECPSRQLEVILKNGISSTRFASQRTIKYSKAKELLLKRTRRVEVINERIIFDARYDAVNNVSHLIHNVIIPLLYIKREIQRTDFSHEPMLVIVDTGARRYVSEAFELLGFDVMKTDNDIQGDYVSLGQKFDHELYALIPEVLNFKLSNKDYTGPKRVFIPRRGDRAIINQNEVSRFLRQFDFETVYMEDLTLREEWEIAENVECAAIVHGAAWSHFVWNKQRANLIDIRSPSFSIKLVGFLSAVINSKFCAVRGQITPEMLKKLDFSKGIKLGPHWPPANNQFKVSLRSLEAALNYLEIPPGTSMESKG